MKKPDFYIVEKYDDVAAFYYIDSDPPVVSVEATGADDERKAEQEINFRSRYFFRRKPDNALCPASFSFFQIYLSPKKNYRMYPKNLFIEYAD